MPKRSARSLHLAAVLAASAQAQTVTSTIPVCPTASSVTITLPTTVTFCPGPHCNGGGSGPMVTSPPSNGPGMPGVHVGEYTSVGADGLTTVLGIWETVYNSLCETGLVPATYTITQPCPCDETPHPTALPTGFETTIVPCSICGPHSPTVTLTQPCPTGPYASQTPSVGQPQVAPAPVAPGSGAAASAGAGASAAAGSGPASAAAGADAGASAQAGPAGASASAGAGASASAQVGPSGSGASAGASAGAGSQAGNGAVPASNGMQVAPMNNTMPASNMTMPAAPGAVQSYVSSATHISVAGFTLLIGMMTAFLL